MRQPPSSIKDLIAYGQSMSNKHLLEELKKLFTMIKQEIWTTRLMKEGIDPYAGISVSSWSSVHNEGEPDCMNYDQCLALGHVTRPLKSAPVMTIDRQMQNLAEALEHFSQEVWLIGEYNTTDWERVKI